MYLQKSKMQKVLFNICIVFLIVIVCESSSNFSKYEVNKSTSNENINKTQITIASEGGSIITNSSTALLKDYRADLVNLGKDLSKSNGKSVVPRKGVVYDSTESSLLNDTYSNMSSIVNLNKTSYIVSEPNIDTLNTTTVKKNTTHYNNTTIHSKTHKPLVLSYEALAKIDSENNFMINENESIVKIPALSSYSHPGMVMPIIITILVVPMFAVVGYMALKRGREAWKNRHYKRMDFLLDGMYNE